MGGFVLFIDSAACSVNKSVVRAASLQRQSKSAKSALLDPCRKRCSVLGSGRQLPAARLGRQRPVKATLPCAEGLMGSLRP